MTIYDKFMININVLLLKLLKIKKKFHTSTHIPMTITFVIRILYTPEYRKRSIYSILQGQSIIRLSVAGTPDSIVE